MRNPENHAQHRFDQLLEGEIKRMSDPSVNTPPAVKQNLTLDEYKSEVVRGLKIPTAEQRERFIEAFQDDRSLIELARPGFKVVPLFMPHEHGYPEFEPTRLKMFGNLYYYVLNADNLTVRADKLAFMDAVLPPEIIENAVEIPTHPVAPKSPRNQATFQELIEFYNGFNKCLDRFFKMALLVK